MKTLHPEYLFGYKKSKVSDIINHMHLIIDKEFSGEDVQSLLDREKKILATELAESDLAKKKKFANSESTDYWSTKMSMFKKIKECQKNGKYFTFRVADAFLDTVSELRRDIPIDHIGKDGSCAFISFRGRRINNTVYDGSYIIKKQSELGSFITIVLTPAENYTIMGTRIVVLCNISGSFDLNRFLKEKVEDENDTTKVVTDMRFSGQESIATFNELIVGIINTSVYLNSKDADIESLKPIKLYNKKELSVMGIKKKESLSNLPIQLVGWSFHGKSYSVDSTIVRTHMRWQPCGTNRSEVRLVWVKEHTRNYSPTTETSPSPSL